MIEGIVWVHWRCRAGHRWAVPIGAFQLDSSDEIPQMLLPSDFADAQCPECKGSPQHVTAFAEFDEP
jgi:hypothetical protein